MSQNYVSKSFKTDSTLVNAFPLRDTNTHTYRTDPNYILLVPLLKHYDEYAVWVYNGTNQTVNVQVIGNVTNDQSYPDYTIGSAYTVAMTSTNMYVLREDVALTPFVSLSVSANTAPTSGSVYAVVIVE